MMWTVIVTCALVGADSPPADLKPAFDMLNRSRTNMGLSAFVWDDRLYKSAQELCERSWARYLAGQYSGGSGDAHWDLDGRLLRAGWPIFGPDGNPLPAPRGARNRNMNYSECSGSGASAPGWPTDRDGWCHAPQNASDWMAETVNFFETYPDRNGPHILDFRTGYNRVGIGHYLGFTAIEYGYIP